MTFLFDIGRVLLDFDFESSLTRLLPPEVTNPQARLATLLERKDEFETGSIKPDDYIAWALEVLGSDAGHERFRHAWRQVFTPNLPMWHEVRCLAATGHRLILFSNTNSIHCPWIFDAFPDFSLFHEAVLSYQTGSIKPHPQIYQHAITRLHLDPATTLYIDDLPDNIAAGRAHGFRCFQYELSNHRAFRHWLLEQTTRQSLGVLRHEEP